MDDNDAAQTVHLPAGGVTLAGDLTLPPGARAVVLFAHGSGSSRRSPRNQYVAELLRRGRLGTLLTDLLTGEEEAVDVRSAHLRFDIQLLAARLTAIIDWLRRDSRTSGLRMGLFGASTGAAAALMAAAERPGVIGAVVSRGGRPDLAEGVLERVCAPTLLIVGGLDTQVMRLNQQALDRLTVEKGLEIVPRATHLFEEPGALDRVAGLARAWFARYLLDTAAAPVTDPSQ